MFLIGYDMVGGYYHFDTNISSYDYTLLEIEDVYLVYYHDFEKKD